MPPMHQIAHPAHTEIRTPVPEQSLDFFTRHLGLTENGSAGDSVFLRAWDDYENITVKLTAHATSGVGRTSLRAADPSAPPRAGRGQACGLQTIESFHTHGTSPALSLEEPA